MFCDIDILHLINIAVKPDNWKEHEKTKSFKKVNDLLANYFLKDSTFNRLSKHNKIRVFKSITYFNTEEIFKRIIGNFEAELSSLIKMFINNQGQDIKFYLYDTDFFNSFLFHLYIPVKFMAYSDRTKRILSADIVETVFPKNMKIESSFSMLIILCTCKTRKFFQVVSKFEYNYINYIDLSECWIFFDELKRLYPEYFHIDGCLENLLSTTFLKEKSTESFGNFLQKTCLYYKEYIIKFLKQYNVELYCTSSKYDLKVNCNYLSELCLLYLNNTELERIIIEKESETINSEVSNNTSEGNVFLNSEISNDEDISQTSKNVNEIIISETSSNKEMMDDYEMLSDRNTDECNEGTNNSEMLDNNSVNDLSSGINNSILLCDNNENSKNSDILQKNARDESTVHENKELFNSIIAENEREELLENVNDIQSRDHSAPPKTPENTINIEQVNANKCLTSIRSYKRRKRMLNESNEVNETIDETINDVLNNVNLNDSLSIFQIKCKYTSVNDNVIQLVLPDKNMRLISVKNNNDILNIEILNSKNPSVKDTTRGKIENDVIDIYPIKDFKSKTVLIPDGNIKYSFNYKINERTKSDFVLLDKSDLDNTSLKLICFMKYSKQNKELIKDTLDEMNNLIRLYGSGDISKNLRYLKQLNSYFREILFSLGFTRWSSKYKRYITDKIIKCFCLIYSYPIGILNQTKLINNIYRHYEKFIVDDNS
ncbi:Hypothetical protein SRAE_0000072900 [Strongyloides ratti]|uniref:Uncharacterized protein n=1 Tax=Strongyloides ratti TaxID=34506 RepID=A0A090L0F6_STRRB|nr:Hypothetical protein SRAE_0000072900 [Strongyloides ratti]CEF61612.1 Hypothetical protein SRAE_0000072900 [Strongyloides ratti]